MLNRFFRPKAIIGTLPNTLTNGNTADATQVMSDLNYIVNQVNANAAPISNPTFTGTLTAAAAIMTGLTTPTGGVKGISTNTDAAAGNVGEYVESIVTSGSPVSLTTATSKTVTSISLTAGDWDVSGQLQFIPAGSTSVTVLAGSISLTNNTDGANDTKVSTAMTATVLAGLGSVIQTIGVNRFSLATTTTIYLIAYSVFSVSTMQVCGKISARRCQPGA